MNDDASVPKLDSSLDSAIRFVIEWIVRDIPDAVAAGILPSGLNESVKLCLRADRPDPLLERRIDVVVRAGRYKSATLTAGLNHPSEVGARDCLLVAMHVAMASDTPIGVDRTLRDELVLWFEAALGGEQPFLSSYVYLRDEDEER